ncbi:chromate efflux transporter [Tranquillimonas alkanivorans]|uniref:Chromate transporter n=1 Tax=Tranquillimonas alkanivorans TaxID=441119 RepID=A0A1I5RBM7_9RHOB|nr:chromate efflux transporter [Tranquillimonas alkanivorans]SFP55938.1 chromate transporter [Tranquillimonas alkanivorans]
MTHASASDPSDCDHPTLTTLSRVFGRIGVMSFGGPAAQIALMHRELVDARGWLSERGFLNALSFCMLLPGPEAMQLATFCGWRLRGVPGGLIAGLLFVLPGAAVVLTLAALYVAVGDVPLVEALFLGVKATVVIIVIEALLRLARRALTRADHRAVAALAFVGIFALHLPFPAIIALSALYGALTQKGQTEAPPAQVRPRTGATVAVWLGIWGAPVALLWAAGATFLTEVALFFSKLAVVTFGGAYAVLAYMTQEVVQERGWLTPDQMMDGLGLAETTPGPLILVTEFVGYVAGATQGGPGLALAAAGVTLWVTFAPCFLWIFAGAPYLDQIMARPRLTGALAAITAAVVGVIANLSIWFAAHVFFGKVGELRAGPVAVIAPEPGAADPAALALAGVAAVLLLRLKRDLLTVLAVCAALGAGLGAVGLA